MDLIIKRSEKLMIAAKNKVQTEIIFAASTVFVLKNALMSFSETATNKGQR
jgi:hypothetical protein